MGRNLAASVRRVSCVLSALLLTSPGIAQQAESHLVSPTPAHLSVVGFQILPSAPDDSTRLEFVVRVRNSGHQRSENGLSLLVECAPVGLATCPPDAPFGSTLPAIPSGGTREIQVFAKPFRSGSYRLTAETDSIRHQGSASLVLSVRKRITRPAQTPNQPPAPWAWIRSGQELIPRQAGAELELQNGDRVRALSAPPKPVRFLLIRKSGNEGQAVATPLPDQTHIVEGADGTVSTLHKGARSVLGRLTPAADGPRPAPKPTTRQKQGTSL